MNIFQVGTLIIGPSGSGKSDLALSLLNRGHQFIADDVPEFYRDQEDNVIGKSPAVTQDFLAITSLGIINVRKLFGEDAIKSTGKLHLILTLTNEKRIMPEQRLFGIHDQQTILDQPIPEIKISINHTQCLTDIVECAVKLWQLESKGYNASEQLMQQTSPQVIK